MVEIEQDYSYDFHPPDSWPEDKRVSMAHQLVLDAKSRLIHNVSAGLRLLDVAKKHRLWELMELPDWDAFLTDAKLSQDLIDTYRRGLEIVQSQGRNGPVSGKQAMAAAVKEGREQAETISRGTRTDLGHHDNVMKLSQGNSTEYTLRRLARDGHDDLLDAIAAGEISVNQAAIQVGYRKVKTTLEKIQALWAKLTDEEQREFLRKVT